jgi:hypothetical protein
MRYAEQTNDCIFTAEPAKEFSQAVGIRVARRGGHVPPLYHYSLPAGTSHLIL